MLPDALTHIEARAFQDLSLLESVYIPCGVTYIGAYAFSGCVSLMRIDIPDSVTHIGGGAFQGCVNLVEVVLPSALSEIKERTFSGCESLKYIRLPDSLQYIGERAFNRSGLESIAIPHGVTEIGEGAFSGCTNLYYVDLPESISRINRHVFNGATSLESITLPSRVTRVNRYAFADAVNLREVNFSENLSRLGQCAFKNTPFEESQSRQELRAQIRAIRTGEQRVRGFPGGPDWNPRAFFVEMEDRDLALYLFYDGEFVVRISWQGRQTYFAGWFSDAQRHSDYIYSFEIETVKVHDSSVPASFTPVSLITQSHGVRVDRSSEAYLEGFTAGSEFLLMLPGALVDDLPNNYRKWVLGTFYQDSGQENYTRYLFGYGLSSKDGSLGFYQRDRGEVE